MSLQLKEVERKHPFMSMGTDDPLKKREEFAVSLRKKKKDQIMRLKRQRLD